MEKDRIADILCFDGTDWIPLPPEAQGFANDFDAGKPVAPSSFSIEVPGHELAALHPTTKTTAGGN